VHDFIIQSCSAWPDRFQNFIDRTFRSPRDVGHSVFASQAKQFSDASPDLLGSRSIVWQTPEGNWIQSGQEHRSRLEVLAGPFLHHVNQSWPNIVENLGQHEIACLQVGLKLHQVHRLEHVPHGADKELILRQSRYSTPSSPW